MPLLPFFLMFVILLLGLTQTSSAKPSAKRPNIILILADDMGYSDLGSFGSEIDTPNLDRLAQQGLRLRQFYNSGKCEPTRTSLMSGQYWQHAGMKIEKGPTLGHVMQSAGYRTYAVGKWHLTGNPVDEGFNRYFGHLGGATDFFLGDNSFHLNENPWPRPKHFYATRAYTDFAIQFVKEGLEQNPMQPFFLYLAQTAPHAPLQALPEDIAKFKHRYDKGWDVLRAQRIERQQTEGILDKHWPIPTRPANIPAWDELTQDGKAFESERMAVYAAMVYRMDLEIGRLIAALEKIGQRDNTLILFLSDNGASPFDRKRWGTVGQAKSKFNTGLGWAWFSNTPYRLYKRNQHQGGASTSFIANWPAGINQKLRGTISDYPAHIVDILATLRDLGGADYPADFKGKTLAKPPGESFAPIFDSPKRKRRNPLYFHLFDHWAIIDNNFKLVTAWGEDMALYDFKNDRAEVNNLANAKPKQAKKLFNQWKSWAEKANVRLKHSNDRTHYISVSEKPD